MFLFSFLNHFLQKYKNFQLHQNGMMYNGFGGCFLAAMFTHCRVHEALPFKFITSLSNEPQARCWQQAELAFC